MHKLEKKHGYKWFQQLQKDMAEFDQACIRGEVPSGGWCKCCERYNCGHYLDDIGGVISKKAHMRLNAE